MMIMKPFPSGQGYLKYMIQFCDFKDDQIGKLTHPIIIACVATGENIANLEKINELLSK